MPFEGYSAAVIPRRSAISEKARKDEPVPMKLAITKAAASALASGSASAKPSGKSA